VDDAARWRRLFDGPLPGPPTATVVVHGDLYARHILVNGARAVSGVLDWGDVHAGDPATDLSLAYGFLPASLRDEFFARYGAADDRTHRAARLRAAFHAVSVTWYAHSVGDDALTRAGLAALRNVLDA
jgi:aminoglycoside phosphotransferase (APT) family kinase protein